MNDLRHPCEHWDELVSLAAAGCLSPDEEREVQQHIETCALCRARFTELTQLCGGLAEARLPIDDTETAIVVRTMSAITSDESRRSPLNSRQEMVHQLLRTRTQEAWRWIMRSPVTRLSAAAVFVFAVTGIVVWFQGGGATFAFADFIAPILDAKTAKFKITAEMKGPPAVTTTGEVMVLGAGRSRQEMEITMPKSDAQQKPATSKWTMIFDWDKGKSLSLDPATKKAMVISLANLTPEQVAQQDMFTWMRSVLLDARDKPDVKREPLGEKTIDGRPVIGFRVTTKGMTMDLWGDPETGLPVRIESTMAIFPNVKTTMSDFEFNVNLDESLFSVDPPQGYTVQNMSVDVSPPEEKDLVTMFRRYSDIIGAFPATLELQAMMQDVGKELGMKSALEAIHEKLVAANKELSEEQMQKIEELMKKMVAWQSAPANERPSEQEMQQLEEQMRKLGAGEKLAALQGKPDIEQIRKMTEENMKKVTEVQIPLQRGLMFVIGLPANADAHYAGKGVEPGAADTPIFWYRPQDSEKYRVIYGDLSIKEADTAPSVPDAQPVPHGPEVER